MTDTVTVAGNLTRDPELRFTPSGMAITKLGLAVNRRWTDQTGEKKEHTSFLSVVCFRDLAGNVADSLKKGDRVLVTGRIDQRSWEDDKGGKRSTVEINADDIGPSLRWAVVEVEKTDRRDAGPRPNTDPAYNYDPGTEPF